MKYRLINEFDDRYSVVENILINRGIAPNDVYHYLNTTDEDICDFKLLGEDRLKAAAVAVLNAIQQGSRAFVIVDSDCDGFTSSAILINYLHDLFPSWVETSLEWHMHEGKQHGLSDCTEYILQNNFQLVFCPDSASNDYIQHEQLTEAGIKIVVLDHHDAEKISENAIIINNQLSDYPNKSFSGAGITWQFCRYLDTLLNADYAEAYRDLAALGNCADMMSLRSFETKRIMESGFAQIKNPFFEAICIKNAYPMGNKVNPFTVAFYVAPFINATVRSGTLKEKELVFKSMLQHEAWKQVPSTKRGHMLNEQESIVAQAMRTITNVKNHQTKAEQEGMMFIDHIIQTRKLLDHKVLLILLEPNQVDKNIAGLIANKMMARYTKPCCILTKVPVTEDDNQLPWEGEPRFDTKYEYIGSARGCDKTGITEFKDICEATGCTTLAQGHQGAFGLGILEDKIEEFISKTDEALKDVDDETLYSVDFIFNGQLVDTQSILDIGQLEDLWGKDVDEPLVCIEKLKVSKEMVTVYAKKDNTLKITLSNKLALILFKAPDELCLKLQNENDGYYEMNIVGTCSVNEWNGIYTPQIKIRDYEIVDSSKFFF